MEPAAAQPALEGANAGTDGVTNANDVTLVGGGVPAPEW